MKQTSIFLLPMLTLALMTSCSSDLNDDVEIVTAPATYHYFNSFETTEDIADFDNYGFQLIDDAADRGGESCLYICGGCLFPHVSFDLGPFDSDMTLTANFMGRTSSYGGGMSMFAVNSPENRIDFQVIDTVWTLHEAEETFLLPAEDTLRIQIAAGGFIPSDTYIDLLNIVEVK